MWKVAITGLGLGLYLVRSIAEAHGGTLTVETAPGQGATFHLALPLSGNQDEHKEEYGTERNHHQDRVEEQAPAVVDARGGSPGTYAGSAHQHTDLSRT